MEKSVVKDEESLSGLLSEVRKAQEKFSHYTQEQTDEIFLAVAKAADKARIPLARMAVGETGMGVFEDKAVKNHYAAEYIYNKYKKEITCGVVERDETAGFMRIAEPVGVVAAIVPTTNPTSTAIFKILLCMKTRNGLILSPHPRAKKCTIETAKLLLDAAVAAGAPEGIIGWIDEPSVALSGALMREADLILATGGGGMVKAAYSSGKPAIGVGSGNTPVIVDASADIPLAASSILHSKTFDNGMICASEQAVVVDRNIYAAFAKEMRLRGGYFLSAAEAEKLRKIMFEGGKLNAEVVGQSAEKIARMAGFEVPSGTKVLIGEVASTGAEEPFAHEKLSPVLAAYKSEDFADALEKASALVRRGGIGHTSVIYLDERKEKDKLEAFAAAMQTGRILVNTPASQGGIGDLYNFRLAPSLTLGCGSWGGNSISENVGVSQLLNIKTVAIRRENMLWFRVPEKIYFKRGCLPSALKELGSEYRRKRAFIVTDRFLYDHGRLREIVKTLDEEGILHTEFFDVTPDPTLACARAGAKAMSDFRPDVVIAFGGGSPMDAAKIMWVLYEHPEVRFDDLAMRFMDIRKRVYPFPKMGEKAMFVAIPTTAGTGSEVTPFAVITDENTGMKYPLADYELTPDMAIVDADLSSDCPKGLTANAGLDALSHAIEAVASVMASDFTDGHAKEAIKLLFAYLPAAYEKGAADPLAREKVAHASAIAGMAFANAFLGVCHSMAHKLGSFWHLPHGMANALLLEETIRFNAEEAPRKMGSFPQYAYPQCKKRYADTARSIGCKGRTDDELVEALIEKIRELLRVLEMPATIREAIGEKGTEEEFLGSLDKMSVDAFDDQCTGANPRYPLVSEIKRMYLNAYYGRHERV